MKELFYRFREKGYSTFGPYFGICPMLLLAGVGMLYNYFEERVIFLCNFLFT